MDVFQELEHEFSKEGPNQAEYVEDFINELNAMWVDPLPSSPPHIQQKLYVRPFQKEAAAIWDACKFPHRVSESSIESGLWEWSIVSGALSEKNDIFQITWQSNTTTYTATWSAFLKWFLCTLGPPVG